MPFISDTASAIKSRFGFSSQSSEPVPLVQSTPDLLKSTTKKNLAHQLVSASSIPSIGEWDDEGDGAGTSTLSFELREDPSFWKDHNVQVIIRIRPLSSSEISTQGYSKCVRQESSQTVTWTGPPPSRFTFDHVADENVSQEKLFKVAGVPMVENCVEGYNSCMFAYGQTGSGKTHTMLGDIEGGTRRHSVNCGMTPRVFEYLFSRIQKEREARREEKLRFICKCSFLEIYNEHILDLLEPSTNNLQIREDIKKGIHVENLKEVEVTSARDVMQQLIQGASNRKVAATNMNRASSRSHSVFTCIIESKWESQGVNHHRFARLNLVDLAGSERQKSSGAEGDRLKEATNINKSLSTLGLVIMNLVNISNGKSQHVPYRDSKLTFLLQDSLGGNSKTIIIANISPANSCLLETLSTLKFAQRAKFIKNNAIVNEDASGDVIAMRMQIQQLKKEVSRLRSLGNGGGVDNQDNDGLTVNFPGSPGSSKWEGLFGSFSPLATAKKTSQKKDYEVALVGAFRREKDKDLALQALAAEIQGAMQLAKQREDENQGLKMRLRFRESAIKRLEAVASGKISAETHLLKEKEEHLKEIEVLKTQVDRNQEVTRFAMENLRLKEEIRRLKSFCEQGERETMSEQISVLHNMLVEALDWKLMHESDPTAIQKSNSAGQAQGDGNLLGTSQEPGTPWRSSIEGENEFLRLQAIQNQSEMDSLHKKLNNCLEEKEKLERRVNELVKELEVEKSSRVTEEGTQEIEHQSLSTVAPIVNFDDQMEIKTMVDAIASASEREAEAHERAIILAKENDELRSKFMVLLEDNNKLIELYEQAAAESKHNNVSKAKIAQLETEVCQSSELAEGKETETKKMVQNLEHQLMEMNEENEKLMGLYEKAMHERDEFKRILSSSGEEGAQTREQFDCPEKFVEVDEGQRVDELNTAVSDEAKDVMEDDGAISYMETDQPDIKSVIVPEDLNLAKKKLGEAQEALSDSARTVSLFGSIEKAIIEVDEVTKEIEAMENGVQVKQRQLESLKLQSSELCERSSLVNKKFSALKYSLSNFSSSFLYFEQREARARARVGHAMSNLNQKKEELTGLQASKDETEASQRKVQQSDVELRNNLVSLKNKFEEEEKKKQENIKVLFAIDNVEKVDPAQRNLNLGGKATELLKSEEEKPKLQGEMKLVREKLGVTRREYDDLDRKLTKIKGEIQAVQEELQKGTQAVEEMELALKNVLEEKEMLMEVKEEGKNEIEIMILDYQQHVFESDLKEEEKKMLEEELVIELKRVEELQKVRAEATEKMTLVLEQGRFGSSFVSEKMVEELKSVNASVLEAKTLLGEVN